MINQKIEQKVAIGKSVIHGKGLFANQDFQSGEVVYQPTGRKVHANNVDWNSLGRDEYDNFLQIGSWKYLNATEDTLFRYLNHSCDPNTGIKCATVRKGDEVIREIRGNISFVAIKPIKRGEEVTFDYSTTMFEEMDEEPLPCKCRSTNCRRIIGDFKTVPKIIQRRYWNLGIAPSYVFGKSTQKNPMLTIKTVPRDSS